MEERYVLKKGEAWAMSTLASAIIITFINGPLTIIKELSPLKGALVVAFGHHWVGHGVVLLISFIVLSLGFRGYYGGRSVSGSSFKKMIILLAVSVFVMLFLVLGFFVYEYTS